MASKHLKLAVAVSLAVFVGLPSSHGEQVFSKSDRRTVLSLAARQFRLHEALIGSDWETAYSTLSPSFRSEVPLESFIASPHPQLDGKFLTSDPKLKLDLDRLKGSKFLPHYFNFRIKRFDFTEDRRFARVVSEVYRAFPPEMGNSIYLIESEEFWVMVDGIWYADWARKYILDISGAKTERKTVLQRYNYSISSSEIASWYLGMAVAAKESDLYWPLLERAFLLDPYLSAQKSDELGMDAGALPERYTGRAIKGFETGKYLYAMNMESGYWHTRAGLLDKAYDSYLNARNIDSGRVDPLEGMVLAAYRKGDNEKALRHFVTLRQLATVTGNQDIETLEPLILDGCSICPSVSRSLLLESARDLAFVRRYDLSAGIYGYMMLSDKGSSEALGGLKDGGSSKVVDLLGEELAAELRYFTYTDIQGLLNAAGIGNFFHPSDDPSLEGPDVKGLTLESLPKLRVSQYVDGYNVSFNRGVVVVSGDASFRLADYYKKGYAAVFVEGGKADMEYFPDIAEFESGNAKLAEKVDALPEGTTVYLARLATGKHNLSDRWRDTLKAAGADFERFPINPSAHVVVFTKGGGPVFAREGFYHHSVTFLPSNISDFGRLPGPALLMEGKGQKDKVKYRPGSGN